SAERLSFHAGGKLAFTPRGDEGAFASYVSDPARPVPSSGATLFMPQHLWMVEDERFSASRPDVLVYETEELAEPVTVAGHIVAKLFAATSGSDSDFIVKLIDVYPGNAPDNDPNPPGVRMGQLQ